MSDNPTIDSTPIILKLGGSVFSHQGPLIDFNYLREFRDVVREQILLGRRFAIITGGGENMRKFADYAKAEGNITNNRDLHWIGAAVNTVHAEIVRGFFGDEVAEELAWKYQHLEQIPSLKYEKPVVIIGGYRPGISSDGVALQVAEGLKAKKVFHLTSTDGVYDADPKTNPEAKFLPELSWSRYLEIIGNPEEHLPGANLPVDVVAARGAKKQKVAYYILKATDFDNLEKALAGEEFRGTIIS